MFEEYIPARSEGFKGQVLDDYLALGYFRMLDEMFTTRSISTGKYGKDTMMTPVFWLRTVISQITEKKSVKDLQKKCGRFSCIVKDVIMSNEFEDLFTLYQKHVAFQLFSTPLEYELLDIVGNPFDSKMIEVRDGSKLIAVGFFDIGKEAILGIRNIYHPDYHKFSLGKYLMLQKIDYTRSNQMKYYYTGYISTEGTTYDYKVFPDENAVEVFMPIEKEWLPFSLKDKNELVIYFEKNVFGDLLGL
jgi:arginine-tRNA-protein transferase